tara:strand:+ start:189 stop:533 length:345 start_codon:yes stop_codon:yes gene_type:complete
MIQTILILFIGAGIGVYHDATKPTKYELQMVDGTQTQVILQKNSHYACPVYCEVDHVHNAVSCKGACKQSHKNFHLHNVTKIEEGTATFCSKKIIGMSRMRSKDKLPDVISASQ